MRVYVPTTLDNLAGLLISGALPAPVPAYAATAELRSWAQGSGPCDEEEIELVALSEGARASLRLLAATPLEDALRVVLAAEVPDRDVRIDDDSDLFGPGQVTLTRELSLAWVRAAHIDEPEAAPAVRGAAGSVLAADMGDMDAEAVVAALDDRELLWYAPEELSELVRAAG